MKKIDKSIILSISYKKWVDGLEIVGLEHPKYDGNASKFRFYNDIVMNLFHCQNGLCYNPLLLLEYNQKTGMFIPNRKLLPNRQKRVKYMLEVLGINHPNVVDKRKTEVQRLILFSSISPREFPTAIQMSR